LTRLGRLAEARDIYLSMPSSTDAFFSSVDVGILSFKRLHNLASVLDELGDYEGASQAWEAASRENPRFSASARSWFDSAARRGDRRGMAEATAWIEKGEGRGERWAHQAATLIALQEACSTEHALQALAREHPGNYWPALLLARILLERGEEGRAFPLLEHAERLGSAEAAFFCGVSANRAGDFARALHHMRRARDLNPSHPETLHQIERLEAVLGA
jgi:tetratricopeptide (TPR) repeat protein